ncbi:DUF1649-domain-containing protein [Auriculariales sp. MPI-PUGE-AT-0066]|nr:DUF1649-domain-containing protein [Auriculariales sp. MPI-PUGE-AT-0066]
MPWFTDLSAHGDRPPYATPPLDLRSSVLPRAHGMDAGQQPLVTLQVTADRVHGREILRGLLHAVLFHRLLGIIKPATIEVLDVTIPKIDDPKIDAMVNAKADALIVTFADRVTKKSWFSSGEEDVTWEQWLLDITAVAHPIPASNAEAFTNAQSDMLTRALRIILEHTSSDQGRAAVPRIKDLSGVSPFPWRIEVRVGSVELAA